MRNTPNGINLQQVLGMVRDRIDGFDLNAMRNSSATSSASPDFKHLILASLKGEAKNGHQILTEIAALQSGSKKPTASHIYPLLEQLVDEGLITATQTGERKVYKITKDGKTALAAHKEKAAAETKPSAEPNDPWPLPRWLDLNGKVVKSSGRLAKSLTEVAQLGTLEQQERVADLLDETRKKVHAILAEDTKIAD
jgi:DNA-binding PadR family transcriptional regulator